MGKRQINEVDFSTIFNYADKKFGVSWNRANDMFFVDGSLTYRSFNEYDLDESLEFIDDGKKFEDMSESEKGYFIINQYMIDNKLEDIFIDCR